MGNVAHLHVPAPDELAGQRAQAIARFKSDPAALANALDERTSHRWPPEWVAVARELKAGETPQTTRGSEDSLVAYAQFSLGNQIAPNAIPEGTSAWYSAAGMHQRALGNHTAALQLDNTRLMLENDDLIDVNAKLARENQELLRKLQESNEVARYFKDLRQEQVAAINRADVAADVRRLVDLQVARIEKGVDLESAQSTHETQAAAELEARVTLLNGRVRRLEEKGRA